MDEATLGDRSFQSVTTERAVRRPRRSHG
ncbi:hypothetical protein RB2654_15390 [Rhodobacterales bacterium HTCC2654]|uniref:Uncharacterized protein n=1 Tax=Maritimibacter alkaliphilus HTCC2654 TaxID=314271 RepID=A3VHC7_9RHOB|nr:hypothetical protein RB2654_15390 [Rhodobacterales bacterium HTCC2654] [Maritimibacter alkaliphilus HTCC2654]